MTSFGGAFQPLFENLPLDVAESSWSAERARPPQDTGLYVPNDQQAGGFTSNLPSAVLSSSLGGAAQPCFLQDYYNQIHFIPRFVDFGPIASEVTVPVVIWNAHLSDVTLNTITEAGLPDVSIAGASLPRLFKPLKLRTYNVTAAATGTPQVAGTYTFAFDITSFVLVVDGLRAKLGFFQPNWRDSYRVTYEYRSEIFTSRSGKEQRRALRTTPRKTIEFTTTLKFNTLRKFNQDLAVWQNRLFIIPEVPRQVAFADVLGLNVLSTTLEYMPDWVVPDAVVILSYKDRLDTRKIAAVDGLDVTFVTAGEAWPAGTLMHPALNGFLASEVTATNVTNAVAEVAITFNVKAGSEAVIDPPAAPTTFNGREVFLLPSNWTTPQQVTYRTVLEQVDYQRGLTEEFRPVPFNTLVVQSAFTGRNFDSVNAIVDFFKRLKGQRGEFYRPTEQADLDFVQAVSGSHNLRVAGLDAFENYDESTVYSSLCILLVDGTRLFRSVSAISTVNDELGEDSVLALATTFPATLTAAQVSRISWMPVCRLASDQLVIEWVTNAVGQTQLTIQTLEELTAE